MEVDEKTIKKEYLFEGRVKVLIDNIVPLPATMPLWVEEVKFTLQIEMEEDCSKQKGDKKWKSLGGKKRKKGLPMWWKAVEDGGNGGGRR